MDDAHTRSALKELPSVDELLRSPGLAPLLARHPRPLGVQAVREAIGLARERLLAGKPEGFDPQDVGAALARLTVTSLRAVLNATGVVLHTNLGRAPLHPEAIARMSTVGAGYANLELELSSGERGSRYAPLVELLRGLTGADDALVVNNGAFAALLALSTLAQGKDAIVSRGELVEIGGGFRVPDVMKQSGATLIEVGTTNRTRIDDYAQAIGPNTGALVKVHQSNFAMVGFTEDTPVRELAALGQKHGVPVYEDLGSGALLPLDAEGLGSEPTVKSVIAAGADLVSFSGDKLLGGPQAGILVGRATVIAQLKQHPLNRAFRVDKLTVAALEATLELYRDGRADELPVRALLLQSQDALKVRAERLQALLGSSGVRSTVVPTISQVGGGSMPLAEPPSWACALDGKAESVHQCLRRGGPEVTPVLARINDDRLLLDVRCLLDEHLPAVAEAVRKATC